MGIRFSHNLFNPFNPVMHDSCSMLEIEDSGIITFSNIVFHEI